MHGDGTHTYTVVDIWGDEAGASSESYTNDNRDSGYESEEASWRLEFPNLAAARRHHGVSRVGCAGRKVTVRVNGEKV